MNAIIKRLFCCLVIVSVWGTAFATNYFTEGTVWKLKSFPQFPDNSEEATLHINIWLEESLDALDKTYTRCWYQVDGKEKAELYSIRAEGSRVYQLNEDKTKEYLIYDFDTTNSNAYVDIYIAETPLAQHSHPRFSKIMRISNIASDLYQYSSVPTTLITFDAYDYLTNEWDYWGKGNWIEGIGSPSGPLDNDASFIGGLYQYVDEVTHNGETVFKFQDASAVNNIDDNFPEVGIKYHPDGTIFHDNEKGFFIQNGKKFITR